MLPYTSYAPTHFIMASVCIFSYYSIWKGFHLAAPSFSLLIYPPHLVSFPHIPFTPQIS